MTGTGSGVTGRGDGVLYYSSVECTCTRWNFNSSVCTTVFDTCTPSYVSCLRIEVLRIVNFSPLLALADISIIRYIKQNSYDYLRISVKRFLPLSIIPDILSNFKLLRFYPPFPLLIGIDSYYLSNSLSVSAWPLAFI